MGATVAAIYDEQCEICQALVTWVRLLDPDRLIDCVPLDPDRLTELHPDLDVEACLRELHVVVDGEIRAGWDAVVAIADELPRARPLAWLDRTGPTRRLARRAYAWLAANRYELSKCRGGACTIDRPAATRKRAPLRVFWTCYNLGFTLRLPLIVAHAVTTQASHVLDHARTSRRRVDLLDGELRVLFLGGLPTDAVPLTFGERFTAIVYRGVLIDPGSTRMRPSFEAHWRAGAVGPITAVTATHHHEEHSGNLDWAAELVGAPVVVAEAIAARLRPPATIPAIRRFFIGQPPPLADGALLAGDRIPAAGTTLQILPAAGHCDDHVVFWDPEERVLLVGDAFMGAYFSSPNPDVDSQAWIDSLERMIALGPEVMVEGHGHVHSLRRDVRAVEGLVHRNDPVDLLTEKLDVLRWVREQVDAGIDEGLAPRAIEASCFPWGRRWSWENVVADETARLMTKGEFSRSELIRSFRRSDRAALPTVLTIRVATSPATEPSRVRPANAAGAAPRRNRP